MRKIITLMLGLALCFAAGCDDESEPTGVDTQEQELYEPDTNSDQESNCRSRPDFDQMCASGGFGECGAYCPDVVDAPDVLEDTDVSDLVEDSDVLVEDTEPDTNSD